MRKEAPNLRDVQSFKATGWPRSPGSNKHRLDQKELSPGESFEGRRKA